MAVMGFDTVWVFKVTTGSGPSTTDFSTGSTRFDLVSDSVKRVAPYSDSAGILGVRGKVAGRARIPQATYEGTLVFECSPAVLDWFLPYMMHDTGTTPFNFLDTTTKRFDFLRSVDAAVDIVYWYQECCVTGFRVSGSSGGLVELSIDIAARDEIITGEATAQALPAETLGTTIAYEPYISGEAVVNLASGDRDCDDFTVSVDHGIEIKHRLSVGPTSFLPGIRTTTFNTNTEWGSTENGLYYDVDEDGIAATITMSRSGMSSVWTMTNLVVSDNAPPITGPNELVYGIEGVCKGALPVSTANEMTVTSDATPT